MTFLAFLGAVAGCVAAVPGVEAVELIKPAETLFQGEVGRIVLRGVASESNVEGFWLGQRLGFFQVAEDEHVCLLGVDLGLAPGAYPLEIRIRDPEGRETGSWSTSLKVARKDYGLERLRLPEEMVTLDAPTLKRVRKEQALFSSLWGERSNERYWKRAFLSPVSGKLLSGFGRRRIINGEPRSPHSGVDLRAASGEPVQAANGGVVVLVGEFFFSGKSVVIDHGLGLYTMYFHLSAVKVKEGDRIRRGTVIGLAGATGRASGPHLHWGARLDRARIDPQLLLEATGGER